MTEEGLDFGVDIYVTPELYGAQAQHTNQFRDV